MKVFAILTTTFAALAAAGPIRARQEASPANEAALKKAREDSAAAIERGQGRGRLLLDEGGCLEACQRCRTSATATAVAEVFACGTAAVAIDVLTAGAAAFLDAAGFVFCEGAVIAKLNEKEETCLKE
ncbi:hypothetical protein DM02DRAFT_621164 [Periconia macrospinosa]|uniref:Fungal calcium binding protein domain-containing protein n=1 Tax=Periconia macrospinosa TaxID=97972 RepID=A0A2V1CXU5_9PLEO|nr:hypothetical protein DM02DRAFT_621164 [Periconia macrospinosa]